MRKHLLVGFVMTAAVVLAGCQAKSPATSPDSASTPTSETGSELNLIDVAKNIATGKSYTCEFVEKKTGQAMSYTLKGKKMAMQFSGKTEGVTTTMNMIGDTESIYIWDPGTKQGMKMMYPEDGLTAPGVPDMPDLSDINAWKNFQQDYKVNCSPSTVGDAAFVPPADVKFQDLSSMMESVPQAPVIPAMISDE